MKGNQIKLSPIFLAIPTYFTTTYCISWCQCCLQHSAQPPDVFLPDPLQGLQVGPEDQHREEVDPQLGVVQVPGHNMSSDRSSTH